MEHCSEKLEVRCDGSSREVEHSSGRKGGATTNQQMHHHESTDATTGISGQESSCSIHSSHLRLTRFRALFHLPLIAKFFEFEFISTEENDDIFELLR